MPLGPVLWCFSTRPRASPGAGFCLGWVCGCGYGLLEKWLAPSTTDWKSPWQQKHARCACGIPRLDKAPPSSALVSALEGSTGGSENERERFILVAGTVGCGVECSKTNAHT